MRPLSTQRRSNGLITHRIKALSDREFFIAMTLLIQDIRVPVISLMGGEPPGPLLVRADPRRGSCPGKNRRAFEKLKKPQYA